MRKDVPKNDINQNYIVEKAIFSVTNTTNLTSVYIPLRMRGLSKVATPNTGYKDIDISFQTLYVNLELIQVAAGYTSHVSDAMNM